MDLKKKNLAVFISGFGSNLNVFLNNKEKFNKILVVSSNSEAYGLQRAQEHGVESLVLDKKVAWETLTEKLQEMETDLIFLAGFMKIVPEEFLNSWQGRIFNLHPSLLPKYKGLKAIERAYEAGDDVGVTIHHVIPEVDGGETLFQSVAIPSEKLASLSLDEVKELTHKKEHELVQRWIDWVFNKG